MANIKDFMNALLSEYKSIRGKNKDCTGRKFWDVVVITTADSTQHEAYTFQIEEKLARNELPLDLPIHIIPDPPGVRIGNGGSTLTALEFLHQEYGIQLFEQKILMIHAGGWSQRMPSASVLGKIFSLLPHGIPPYQMLDLKLALYWPFVDKIAPGVFLACADDFVVYSFGDKKEWTIPINGFTALAHPSPVEIGKTHGVFVIGSQVDTTEPVEVKECLQALQKPTYERMIEHGALINGDSHTFPGGNHIEGQAVFTDSSFFFGTDVMKKLLRFKKSVGNLNCEIDAYGDFLQAVGSRANDSYIHQTSNVSQLTSNLIDMRGKVFEALKCSDFHVLLLNASSFIHIGTASELIHYFCEDIVFQERMGFENIIFSAAILSGVSRQLKFLEKTDDLQVSSKSCIMHSILDDQSKIEKRCVIEYCDLELPVHVSSGSIVSNCQLVKNEATLTEHVIPHNSFLHTIPVSVNNKIMYVTVYFHTNNDLKKSTSAEEVEKLALMNSSLQHFLKTFRLKKSDIIPQTNNPNSVNLWNLKLYPAKASMTLSFEAALSSMSLMACSEKPPLMDSQDIDYSSDKYFSLADILNCKEVKQMLNYRKSLYNKISGLYTKQMKENK